MQRGQTGRRTPRRRAMADRFRRFGRDDTPTTDNGGGVATDERGYAQDPPPPPPANGNGATAADATAATARARTADDAAVLDREARLRQRDEFGGINWGASFFGWVVAIGIGVLLTAIVSAAGAAIGLTDGDTAKSNADTIGIVGG